jgi:hypothetical protein
MFFAQSVQENLPRPNVFISLLPLILISAILYFVIYKPKLFFAWKGILNMFKTKCLECGNIFTVPPHYINHQAKCPSCQKSFTAYAIEEAAAMWAFKNSQTSQIPEKYQKPQFSDLEGKHIYLFTNAEQRGPFLLDQVQSMWRSGSLTADTLWWVESMSEWAGIQELPKSDLNKIKISDYSQISGKQQNIEKEIESKSSNQTSSLVFWSISLFVCMLIIAGIAFKNSSNKSSDFLSNSNVGNYKKDCGDIVVKIIFASNKCEERAKLVSSLWSECISNRLEFEDVYKTFERDTYDTIRDIKKEKTDIEDRMSSITSPPDECKNMRKSVVELFNSYSQIYELAISPSGNYLSYNSKKSEAFKSFSESLSKLKYENEWPSEVKTSIDTTINLSNLLKGN